MSRVRAVVCAVVVLAGSLEARAQPSSAQAAVSGDFTRTLDAGEHTCLVRDRRLICWGGGDAVPALAAEAADVTSVAATRSSWCALHVGGGVSCAERVGERTVAERVEGVRGARAVVSGEDHVCVIRRDRTVACWGDNQAGQLGDGTTRRAYLPVTVPGVADVSRLAAAYGVTCALGRDARITCWGNDPLSDQSTPPRRLEGLTDVVDLDVGQSFGCAVRADGSVWCWGRYPAPGSRHFSPTAPTAICGVNDAVAVSVGSSHACALRRDGRATCWGGEPISRGTGCTDTCPDLGVVEGVADAVEISAADRHTCARSRDGAVRCWGRPDAGQLGQGDGPLTVVEPPVPGVRHAVEVATGFATSCARTRSGRVWCWGTLGRDEALGVTPIPQASPAARIVLGHRNGCAIRRAGDVVCWGPDGRAPLPTTVRLPGVRRPRDLAVDGGRALVLERDGTLRCFGCRERDGPWQPVPTHSDVLGRQPDARQVRLLRSGWCVRLSSGAVRCAGLAGGGRDTTVMDFPNVSGVEELAVGRGQGYGRRSDGSVVQWALYHPARAQPTPVEALRDVLEVVAAEGDACARTRAGEVWCWGASAARLLGSTGLSSPIPVRVPGLVGVESIALGWSHACALVGSRIRCFGAARDGATGPGAQPPGARPVLVALPSNLAP